MKTAEDFLAEARRIGLEYARRAREYTGGPKPFRHNGLNREAAYPWLSDEEIAGKVRMLMRDDLEHESIVCAARDRILHLSQENERLRSRLEASNMHERTDIRDRAPNR